LKSRKSFIFLAFKASETNLLIPQELASAKHEMGDDKYLQEFECSFNAAVEGSYYGKIINELEEKNQITTIPREELSKTYCAWDLGISDSTAIWVAQVVGKEIRLLDFYEIIVKDWILMLVGFVIMDGMMQLNFYLMMW
jgi:hypothetical protein